MIHVITTLISSFIIVLMEIGVGGFTLGERMFLVFPVFAFINILICQMSRESKEWQPQNINANGKNWYLTNTI